jgi:hypothetical protein
VVVVIGSPVAVLAGKRILPAGRSVAVAEAVRHAGGDVQLVGKVAEDLAGDAIVLDLGRRGIGHAALARAESGLTPKGTVPAPESDDAAEGEPGAEVAQLDEDRPAHPAEAAAALPDGLPLDAGDLKLALGYLQDVGAIVVAAPLGDDAASVVAESAAYHGAPLVVLVAPGAAAARPLSDAIVLEAPNDEDSFARLVGAYAVRLEAGADARDALREVTASAGWERAE